jgi:hypothetical protein
MATHGTVPSLLSEVTELLKATQADSADAGVLANLGRACLLGLMGEAVRLLGQAPEKMTLRELLDEVLRACPVGAARRQPAQSKKGGLLEPMPVR